MKNQIEEIYNQNFKKIYKFFYFKFLSKEIAEDLTSETFLQFVQTATNQDIQNNQAYLFGIARNIFMKALKEKYKENETGLDFEPTDPEGYIEEFVKKMDTTETPEEKLLKYIDQLPEKQAQIIKMRLIEKLNLKEICEKFGKDMNYVKTTQKRAIKSLRKIIACTP
jgi:RNA polymerase sigma-70 factor, ECF subfamily